MTVMTVTGPVDTDTLGITLPHEHIFIDIRNQFVDFSDSEAARVGRQKVSLENVDALRRNPYAIKDNLCLDDMAVAVEEVGCFKSLGGTTIVDCTCAGIGRDGRRLREVASRTGLNIIAGCGYYTFDTHPVEMFDWPADRVAEQLIADLTVGMDGTDIRAGVIGEIGTSCPIHPNERKNLVAAATASRHTGAPVYVHTYPWGKTGIDAADTLLGAGIRPDKVVICHTDVAPCITYMRELLSRDVFLEFDNFGKEFDIPPEDRGFAGGVFVRDTARIEVMRQLLELGFAGQILIANDICLKSMLHACGGQGYDHILRNIVPMMLDRGIPRETIDMILVSNPRKVLC